MALQRILSRSACLVSVRVSASDSAFIVTHKKALIGLTHTKGSGVKREEGVGRNVYSLFDNVKKLNVEVMDNVSEKARIKVYSRDI